MNRFGLRHSMRSLRSDMIRSLRTAAPLVLLLFLIGCGEDSSPRPAPLQELAPPDIAKIQITPNSAILGIGAEEQFLATVLNGQGEVLTGINLVWKIDNPTAATVSSDGWVKGLQEGTATLTASFGDDVSNPAEITVVVPPEAPPIASIDVTSTHRILFVGNQARFTATAKDPNGRTLQGILFSWSSSAPEIVSVDQRGLATALAPGDAAITVTVAPPDPPVFTPLDDAPPSQSAILTVTDDNSPPIALMTTTARRGEAPFTVAFSGTRSDDPDGWITFYTWNFGDGSPPFYAPTARHTYERPGEFIATLTVTDPDGATTIASAAITVDP
ncbi:MAG: Ig-like domain-containing protein [Candidatus Manganitrophus sp.]|nr:MAG: Ig-like domain-containing protein [Candidatus Manganitrophus sp.]